MDDFVRLGGGLILESRPSIWRWTVGGGLTARARGFGCEYLSSVGYVWVVIGRFDRPSV